MSKNRYKVNKVPNIVGGGTAIPLGGDYFLMKGRTHETGGIDLGPNNKNGLEVENDEILKIDKNNIKIFSAQPIIGGHSPAELILKGVNPNKVFNAQEKYKDRFGLNDDGTKKRIGGEENERPEVVQRVDRSLADFAIRLRDPNRKYIKDYADTTKIATHKMSAEYDYDGNPIIYSNVQTVNGELIDLSNPKYGFSYDDIKRRAIETGDTVRARTLEDAIWFAANNYKKYYPDTILKDGSKSNWDKKAMGGNTKIRIKTDDKGNASIYSDLNSNKQYKLTRKSYNNNDNDNNTNDTITKTDTIDLNNPLVKAVAYKIESEYPTFENGIDFSRLYLDDTYNNLSNPDSVKIMSNYPTAINKSENTIADLSTLGALGWSDFRSNNAQFAADSFNSLNTFTQNSKNNRLGKDYLDDNALSALMAIQYLESLKPGQTDFDDNVDNIFNYKREGAYKDNPKYNMGMYSFLTEEGHAWEEYLNWIDENNLEDSTDSQNYYYLSKYLRDSTLSNRRKDYQVLINPDASLEDKVKALMDAQGAGTDHHFPMILDYAKTIGRRINKYRESTKDKKALGGISNQSLYGGTNKNRTMTKTSNNKRNKAVLGMSTNTWLPQTIEGVVNTAGSLAGYFINKNALKGMREPSAPSMLSAAKLKTRVNINPQLAKLRETAAEYDRFIRNNTSSSQTAAGRLQYIRNILGQQENELYADKENKETELINQDILNRQQIRNENVKLYNDYRDKVTNFRNTLAEAEAENTVGLFNNLANTVSSALSSSGEAASSNRDFIGNLIQSGMKPDEAIKMFKYFMSGGKNLPTSRFGGKYPKKLK